jgi:type VI secretion system secreted protein VgrG
MPKTQDNTFLSLKTPLGPDTLLLDSFTGVDEISRPFRFELELVSEAPDIAFDQIVGQRVTLTIDVLDGTEQRRYVNGFVSRFSQHGADSRFSYYQAEVVPWLWLLTKSADCRIFQDKTAPEIIKQVFSDRGMVDFEDCLEGTYPKLVYCVQYRERDIDFVSRLMEEFGICYFFRHEEERHVLVLADAPSAFVDCPHQKKARFKPDARTTQIGDGPGVVTALSLEQELHTGKYSHTDFNFETPSNNLRCSVPTKTTVGGNAQFEHYDYPGRYGEPGQGEVLARIRIEEHETPSQTVSGSSTCRAFLPGFRFELVDHPRSDANKSYALVSVQHYGNAGESSSDRQSSYNNRFHCIPSTVPFRAARRTQKPIVQGPQTAIVVGPSGDEIYTDKYGRVKVQFHWDRLGKSDQQSSVWVRVSQHFAGKRYGSMFIPRIGQEVIVDFLEGDPDQPMITGRVYNSEQMPPYDLPGEKTKTGIKTNSSKGGGGSNELRFEDKKGSEEVYLHAQKDFNEVVENNHSTKVKADQSNTVSGAQTETVTKDQKLTITKGNQTVTLDNGNQTVTLTKGNQSTTIAQGNRDVKISAGSDTLTVAKEIKLSAGVKLTLEVGGSSIVLEPALITIKSPLVKIN